MPSARSSVPTALLSLAAGALLLPGVRSAVAAPYPTRACVTKKLEAAAGACRGILLAWAQLERSRKAAERTASLTHTAQGLAGRWDIAEAGGVIPFAQWVEQMRMDDPAWSNQECTDCSLNPGDPAPSPPVPPFNADGTVSCPAS